MLEKVAKDLASVLKQLNKDENKIVPISGWLRLTLFAENCQDIPPVGSTGTWFVSANKTFNSGQDWYREGEISPWSFLLALEGAILLVGGIDRRLSAKARPYAVFPFVTEAPAPASEGEIGLAKAEFWGAAVGASSHALRDAHLAGTRSRASVSVRRNPTRICCGSYGSRR